MGTERSRKVLSPEEEMKRRTRRSFVGLTLGAAGVAAGWHWLVGQPLEDELQKPLRSVLGVNEHIVRGTLYSNNNLTRTYPASAVGKIKVNGEIGMDDPVDVDAWHLQVAPYGGQAKKLELADVQSLPRHEQIINFKCVEGWSTVTQFAGARLSDFTARFAPGSEKALYVGMQTPLKDYYVGFDMPSALHPQSLLAWEMNGKPLTDRHGAPLRLVIPVKYGIKNIKRIGQVFYTDKRPSDYWAEQGYDYYSGL